MTTLINALVLFVTLRMITTRKRNDYRLLAGHILVSLASVVLINALILSRFQ